MKTSFVLCLAALSSISCCAASTRFITTPLVGYQQGVMLQITPPAVAGDQCLVYGVPTPTGYADQASTPLFLYTPKGTGSHNLQFAYNKTAYTLSPFLAPGQTKLQIDASDETNPLISFDSTASPQGQSGAVTICIDGSRFGADLSDKASGAIYCSSQIQFTVDAPLSCLPTYGGVYTGGVFTSGQTVPSGAGNFVIPSGSVYAPTFVQNIIIQQFITINNININTVIINVDNITNNTIIVHPPSPAPVNCTTHPRDPACRTPVPSPGPAPPSPPVPSPTHQPPKPPAPGPATPTPAPTTRPPVPSPATPTPAPTTKPPVPSPATPTPTPTQLPPLPSPPTPAPTRCSPWPFCQFSSVPPTPATPTPMPTQPIVPPTAQPTRRAGPFNTPPVPSVSTPAATSISTPAATSVPSVNPPQWSQPTVLPAASPPNGGTEYTESFSEPQTFGR